MYVCVCVYYIYIYIIYIYIMCICLDSLTRYSELSISTIMGDKKGKKVLGASLNLYFINLLTYYYILKK